MNTLNLDAITEAQKRIEPYIRRTPTVEVHPLKNSFSDARIFLKLESLQITGSFKAWGAVSKLKTLSSDQIDRGIVTASGGNHGLVVAYAGWIAKRPATVFVSS